MFRIEKVSDNQLNMEVSGKLGSEDMKRALDELVEKSKGIAHGKLLFDVVDYHLPSLGAIAVELSRLPSMLGFIRKFDRAAVTADEDWLKTISELEGKLIPGLTIKGFNRSQRVAAEAWLNSPIEV